MEKAPTSEYRTGLCILLRGVLDVVERSRTPAIDWRTVVERIGCGASVGRRQAESVWRWSTHPGETPLGIAAQPVPSPAYLAQRLASLGEEGGEIQTALLELAATSHRKRKKREEAEQRKRRAFADTPTASLSQAEQRLQNTIHTNTPAPPSADTAPAAPAAAERGRPAGDAGVMEAKPAPLAITKLQGSVADSGNLSPSQSVALTPNSAMALGRTGTPAARHSVGSFLSSDEGTPHSAASTRQAFLDADAPTPMSLASTQRQQSDGVAQDQTVAQS